jgi:hypothetical protein
VRPVQVLGDISYSVYLWHWPLLILSAYALDRPLRLPDKLVLIAVTLGLAAGSTYLVENPIRYWRRARPAAPRVVVRGAIAAMAAVLVIASSGLAADALRQGERDRANTAVLRDQASCLGARGLGTPACSGVIAADVLIPDPERAADDGFNLPECWATVASAELHVCTFGPAAASVRLMVIGDSHSNALLPAYRAIADARGWQVQVAGHNGCYWTAAVQRKPTQAMVDGCEAWKRALAAWLAAAPPFDAIIVTSARRAAPAIVGPGQRLEDVTVDGLVQALGTQIARGSRIIAIRDNPDMGPDVATCVVRHRADANTACAVPAAQAFGGLDALVEAARQTSGARLVDLTDIYCPSGTCLPVIGHVVVYSNRDHVTGTWALTLSDLLGARLAAALAP